MVLSGGLPVFYLDSGKKRLTTFPTADDPEVARKAWQALLAHIRRLRRRKLRLAIIDETPAGESPHAETALAAGFRMDPDGLALELPL